jgi:hypothetical protein
MKTDPGNDEEKLSKLLKEWRTDVPLPLGFQECVWRRIERPELSARLFGWSVIAHWINNALPRPALTASYMAILLAVGLSAGWVDARHTIARVKDELGNRYVQLLDPYQTPRQ